MKGGAKRFAARIRLLPGPHRTNVRKALELTRPKRQEASVMRTLEACFGRSADEGGRIAEILATPRDEEQADRNMDLLLVWWRADLASQKRQAEK